MARRGTLLHLLLVSVWLTLTLDFVCSHQPVPPSSPKEVSGKAQEDVAQTRENTSGDNEAQQPVRVVAVLRHGARTPNNNVLKTQWPLHRPSTLGVLTDAGRLGAFVLGRGFGRRYQRLLLRGGSNAEYHRQHDGAAAGEKSGGEGIERGETVRAGKSVGTNIGEGDEKEVLKRIQKISMQPLKRWIMRSSSRERAVESAEYFLRGFFGYGHGIKRSKINNFLKQINSSGQDAIFDPESIKGLEIPKSSKKPAKPLLILTSDRSRDPLLKSHHVEVCKYGKSKAEEHAAKIIDNFLNKDSRRSFSRASSALSKVWNISVPITPRLMKKISDICISHRFHHPEDPVCGKYPELEKYLENINTLVHSSYYTDNTFLKVSLHNLLKYLSGHLAPSSNSPDFIFISTHESTLTPLLRLLNYKDWDKPLPYSASITFEVYHTSIKVYYNKQLLQICPLESSGMNGGCSHLRFAEIIRKGMFVSDEAFEQHCEVPLGTKDLRRLVDKLTGKWQLPLVILCVVVTSLAFKVVQTKKIAVLVEKPKAA